MKITPKPITASDRVDQSRNVLGFSKWAQSSRPIGFIMFILGWFTIPMEVFFRRDFGQRWLTKVNFFAGLILLFIFCEIRELTAVLGEWIAKFESWFNLSQVVPDFSFGYYSQEVGMWFFFDLYILMGVYHLFKIWWRTRANTSLHSFDDGTSQLEPLAGVVMWVLNVCTAPYLGFFKYLLPRVQRKAIKTPTLINDRTAFTNTAFEPIVVFIFAYLFHGVTSLWLFISAISMTIHASWKETAKLNKILDFRDSIFEAQQMADLMNEQKQPSASQLIMQQAATTIKNNPQVAPQVAQQYPDLMSIIEEMNSDKSHLAS